MKSNFIYLLILVGISTLAQALTTVMPDYFTELFMYGCINAILAVSLNLVN
jgi:hypothetical protein